MRESSAKGSFSTIAGVKDGARLSETEARNGLRHALSLSMTKIADGLIDPKLVLSWLLTALGASAVYAGALVPIREAGALLPQMPLAGLVARTARRKWIWVFGSMGQGIGAALIALSALTLEGAAAGIAVCGALAFLALCRAACSVSYKDILGKTVSKSRRGAVTGLAGSASSVGVFLFALLLMSGLAQSQGVVIAAIALAALLWGCAATLFASITEEASETESTSDADFSILKDHPMLRRFILVRGLLVSTALAPPYLVVLGGSAGEDTLGQLGALVLASSVASFVSSYIWGRLADRSSRTVLSLCGTIGGLAMLAAVALWATGMASQIWAMPVVLFILMIAYHGVRQGRSTYLVDLAPEDKRAAFAAVSNTVIGGLLLVAGVLGGGAALIGAQATLVVFAIMAFCAALMAIRLEEVESGI